MKKKTSTKRKTKALNKADVSGSAETTIFTIAETHGDLPYSVIWIGLHKLLSVAHFGTFKEAQAQYHHLLALGREPAMMVDITEHFR